jgi:hypothetical protein
MRTNPTRRPSGEMAGVCDEVEASRIVQDPNLTRVEFDADEPGPAGDNLDADGKSTEGIAGGITNARAAGQASHSAGPAPPTRLEQKEVGERVGPCVGVHLVENERARPPAHVETLRGVEVQADLWGPAAVGPPTVDVGLGLGVAFDGEQRAVRQKTRVLMPFAGGGDERRRRLADAGRG